MVNESQLEQFAMEYELYQSIDQSSQVDLTTLPAVDPDDSNEYNLTNGREIINDLSLEIGITFDLT